MTTADKIYTIRYWLKIASIAAVGLLYFAVLLGVPLIVGEMLKGAQ